MSMMRLVSKVMKKYHYGSISYNTHQQLQQLSTTASFDNTTATSTHTIQPDNPLSKFNMYGYIPSQSVSEDENYMDIVMIITRSSLLRQGSMGCILVRSTAEEEDGSNHTKYIFNRIIAAANNSSIFKAGDSDVHAEVNALGQVAKSQAQQSTLNCTAYITMQPCNNCFGALYSAGIKRIVTRKPYRQALLEAASHLGIEMKSLTKDEFDNQKVRLAEFFSNDTDDNVNMNMKHQEVIRRRRQKKDGARKTTNIATKDDVRDGIR